MTTEQFETIVAGNLDVILMRLALLQTIILGAAWRLRHGRPDGMVRDTSLFLIACLSGHAFDLAIGSFSTTIVGDPYRNVLLILVIGRVFFVRLLPALVARKTPFRGFARQFANTIYRNIFEQQSCTKN